MRKELVVVVLKVVLKGVVLNGVVLSGVVLTSQTRVNIQGKRTRTHPEIPENCTGLFLNLPNPCIWMARQPAHAVMFMGKTKYHHFPTQVDRYVLNLAGKTHIWCIQQARF